MKVVADAKGKVIALSDLDTHYIMAIYYNKRIYSLHKMCRLGETSYVFRRIDGGESEFPVAPCLVFHKYIESCMAITSIYAFKTIGDYNDWLVSVILQKGDKAC
ncbi:MAG: hypothetical protein GY861_22105 [bacterium]|nr:hypothetical protein [bacterium]